MEQRPYLARGRLSSCRERQRRTEASSCELRAHRRRSASCARAFQARQELVYVESRESLAYEIFQRLYDSNMALPTHPSSSQSFYSSWTLSRTPQTSRFRGKNNNAQKGKASRPANTHRGPRFRRRLSHRPNHRRKRLLRWTIGTLGPLRHHLQHSKRRNNALGPSPR